MQPDKIAVGWIDPEFVSGFFAQSMAAQLRDMEYFGCAGKVLRVTKAQPVDARNKICKLFLEETDDEWLWMMDADQMYDKGHVMKLWEVASEYDVKIVSGLGWLQREKTHPSIFYWGDDGKLYNIHNQIPDGPRKVAATGLASMLIHRDVLEAMQPFRSPYRRWFDFLLAEELGIAGEKDVGIDVQFCIRAAQAGYPMMVNPDARTRHLEDDWVDFDTWREDWKETWNEDWDGS